jgi:hypothetical protein
MPIPNLLNRFHESISIRPQTRFIPDDLEILDAGIQYDQGRLQYYWFHLVGRDPSASPSISSGQDSGQGHDGRGRAELSRSSSS